MEKKLNTVKSILAVTYPNVSLDMYEKHSEKLWGFMLERSLGNAIPLIYVERIEGYEDMSALDLAAKIALIHEESKKANPAQETIDVLKDFESAKDYIKLRITDKELPHYKDEYYLSETDAGLCIVGYVQVGDFGAPISKNLLNTWNVTPEDVLKAGQKISEPVIAPFGPGFMFEFLANPDNPHQFNLMDQEYLELPLILTNTSGIFGGSSLFDPRVLEKLAMNFKKFVVIPSSVHEVLLFEYDETSFEYYKQMVREVNRDEGIIDGKDVLSNDIFVFNFENGTIERID